MEKKLKFFISLLGIVLFLTGITSGGYLFWMGKQAVSRDNKKTSFGMIEGPLPCTWDVQPPERVTSENKSQAVIVDTKNVLDESCESLLSLSAPGFDVSPPKVEQKITLAASQSGSLSWILSPRKTGSFEIAVSDAVNTKIFGISVTNTFGLTTSQAKIFSIIGSLFGPMFTVPWWWEKLRERKR